ncbi:ras guanine nucleotide exchange factor domain-containing protein [Cladochytrium replicatum]|nr:ras guanine nucleotide exchange factor domain-containing protein [Cladochytrium replicatum]
MDLIRCAELGDIKALRQLLDAELHSNVDDTASQGVNVKLNETIHETARSLSSQSPTSSLSARDDGGTALHVAASAGKADLLDVILKQGRIAADSQDHEGNTALHLAVVQSDLYCVKHLLTTGGANPFIQNSLGYRPIDYATDPEIEQTLAGKESFNTQVQRSSIESALPTNTSVLRIFTTNVILTHKAFQDRCKETIYQLLEEKQNALYKIQLYEQSAGVHDGETAERFWGQLQYWQDENERQGATIQHLKQQIQMVESAMSQQDEYYRKNLADITKQHTEQLQAIFRKNEENEQRFIVCVSLSSEQHIINHNSQAYQNERAAEEYLTLNRALQKDVAQLKTQLSELTAEKVASEERLRLTEKLKAMQEKENTDLRVEMNKLRKTVQEDMIKQMQEVRKERDAADEESGDIVFTTGEGGTKTLKGATTEKLVERLIDPAAFDNQFAQTFILTHKCFMSSSDLFALIIKKVSSGPFAIVNWSDPTNHNPMAVRLVNTLKYWVENFWNDFAETDNLPTEISAFAEGLGDTKLGSILKSVITRKLMQADTTSSQKASHVPAPKPILPKGFAKRYSSGDAGSLSSLINIAPLGSHGTAIDDTGSAVGSDGRVKLIELDPLELARQLTLIEFELFTSIKAREFLDLAWMKDDKDTRAPNIMKMTRWFNHVVHWLISEIVSMKDNWKQRASMIEKVIMLGYHLEKLNNFNGVKEVLAAMQSSSIFRLKKTKEAVGTKFLKVHDQLIKVTSSELNFKNLRAKVHAADPPLIPFPGVYQGDLVFLDTCSKNKLEGGLINFHKFQKISSYILELQTYQQTPYSLEPVTEIQEYIKNYRVLDEEVAYNFSLICEPRN